MPRWRGGVTRASAWRRAAGPLAIVSSGETTVTVRGPGRGGRNQEFALALVDALQDAPRPAALVSIGTDGIDGPTDAAGAVVDPDSAGRARAAGLDPPVAYLDAQRQLRLLRGHRRSRATRSERHQRGRHSGALTRPD